MKERWPHEKNVYYNTTVFLLRGFIKESLKFRERPYLLLTEYPDMVVAVFVGPQQLSAFGSRHPGLQLLSQSLGLRGATPSSAKSNQDCHKGNEDIVDSIDDSHLRLSPRLPRSVGLFARHDFRNSQLSCTDPQMREMALWPQGSPYGHLKVPCGATRILAIGEAKPCREDRLPFLHSWQEPEETAACLNHESAYFPVCDIDASDCRFFVHCLAALQQAKPERSDRVAIGFSAWLCGGLIPPELPPLLDSMALPEATSVERLPGRHRNSGRTAFEACSPRTQRQGDGRRTRRRQSRQAPVCCRTAVPGRQWRQRLQCKSDF